VNGDGGARPKAVLGVGAGVAAYKVAFVASRLVQLGVDVRVAMTPASLAFVGPATFGGLTASQPILSSTQVDEDGSVPHIDAARGAGVYCIAPATAGVLAQLASGAADDPVALLATTVRCPVVLCPAMNDAMWQRESVQQNVATLRARGLELLGPVEGHLAEGYDAIGRMVEPDEIVARLCRELGIA
jgi:phosphopantothenoylcysteine decarboxylase/phosphopantothenate--cysteine ligase